MMAVTVFVGVLLAQRYDAISLSLLATIGGFLTPVLLGVREVRQSLLIRSLPMSPC